MKRKLNFDILESLRGMAALYVCIGHSRANLWIGGEKYLQSKEHPGFLDYLILGLNMLTRLSTEFVIIFFVLSGFSIAHSLRKSTDAPSFYKRRFIRLYPPYLVALFWAMAVMLIIYIIAPQFLNGSYNTPTMDRLNASRQLFSWDVFFQNLFYLPHQDGILRPFWSLTMEVIFYLSAPFLFRNKKMYYSITALLFLTWASTLVMNWQPHPVVLNYLFYNLFFAFGVALYDHHDRVLNRFRILTTNKALLMVAGLFFTMIGISLVITKYETITAFFAAAMSIILIVYLLANNREIKWLIGVGRFSYTLYITHFPTIMLYMVLFFMFTNATPPYIYNNLAFVPCVLMCLGIAYVQYFLVEKRSKLILDAMRSKEPRKARRFSLWPFGKTETE